MSDVNPNAIPVQAGCPGFSSRLTSHQRRGYLIIVQFPIDRLSKDGSPGEKGWPAPPQTAISREQLKWSKRAD